MDNPFAQIYKEVSGIVRNNGPAPEFPLLIDVEITSKCNLKCIMCEHTYMKRKQEMMSGDVFSTIIQQCIPFKPGVRFIMFSEPFLHPEIISYSKLTKEAGLLLHITTNGTVLTEAQIDKLLDIGLDSITFSMQGLTEKEYAYMRKNNKLLEITEKIKYLAEKRKNKPHIQISTTISNRDNKQDVEEFKRKWSDYADLVTVGVTSWTRVAKMQPNIYDITGIKPDEKKEHLPCQDILTKMCIYSNGDVTVCCDDTEGKMVLGNVMKDKMKELWDSEAYKGLRLLLKNMKMDMFELCKNCYPAYDL
jgi:radical SAM protein with 4Fe4S-binding SPASM domain